MLVREVMSSPVVSVPIGATLEDAVERMLEHGVGSLVVTEGGESVGILTTTDVLIAGHETGQPLADVTVGDAASRPLITIGPDATVRAAAERMRGEGVKRLPVADGFDLLGIVSQQDVVFAHPDLIREAVHNEERREQWESGEGPV